MDWFGELVESAESAWDSVTETGSQYVSSTWSDWLNPSENDTRQDTVAALPGAQDADKQGQGTSGSGINWTAIGVGVSIVGVLLTLARR